MNRIFEHKRPGLAWGSFIGDALAMPVHWYYDRTALHRDYGVVRDYVAPQNPHPDSVLERSNYAPLNARGDILREQARYWGKPGIHYHQFLHAGENTLNLRETIFSEAGDWISSHKAEEWSRDADDVVIGERLSAACYIPNAFLASLYLAWKYADDFEAGVIANTNVGGENCHRGAVIGAMLGGAAGMDRLPARFVAGIQDRPSLHAQITAPLASPQV